MQNKKTEEKHNEIAGILLFALAILIFLSLVSFQAEKFFLGKIGEIIGSALLGVFKYGAYILPFLVGIWGWTNFRGIVIEKPYLRLVSIIALMLCVCSFLNLVGGNDVRIGGNVGCFIDDGLLSPLVGKVGSFIIILTLTIVFVSLLTGISLKEFAGGMSGLMKGMSERRKRIVVKKPVKDRQSSLLIRQKEKARELEKKKEKKRIEEKRKEREAKQRKEKHRSKTPSQTAAASSSGSEVEYKLPVMDFLNAPAPQDTKQEQSELNEKARVLESTLDSFSISAKVRKIYPGPVITRYEIELAPGVKVSAVSSLSNDLALALKAKTIVILAPIPGKSAVGIEIPNKDKKIIHLRELLQSDAYKKSKSLLTFALGKTVSGGDYVGDLAKMPHLLVAGATGAGKSVCLNTMVTSILYKAKPDEVKFIMIDPKMVELPVYNGIKHLLNPVVTNVKEAVIALGWAVAEMEKRYKKFAEHVKRDIADYNEFSRKTGVVDPMPAIVIIIDELADLMTMASKQVEKSVLRIAQKSRAVGIHLVIATQRPSVDVLTGIIKANIPARIAFQVTSRVNSNIILDMSGAENLIGEGDMYYLPSGAPKPVRLQGGYIDTGEISKIVEHVKSQGSPDYTGGIVEVVSKLAEGKPGGGEDKELTMQACRLIIERKQASTSLFKGALRISDGRASNLISLLETAGLIGPSQGSRPREVFIKEIEKYLEELEAQE